jgi:hypothetical protein
VAGPPVRAVHDVARGAVAVLGTVARRQPGDELRVARAAAGAGEVVEVGRAVERRRAIAVRADRVDQGQTGDGVLEREGGDRAAARRPADEVGRGGDAECLEQRERVVGPVAQPARGVDRHPLAVPEPAHVRRQQAIARGSVVEQVLEEPAGREVAVDEDDRDAVLRPGLDEGELQARRGDAVRTHRARVSAP